MGCQGMAQPQAVTKRRRVPSDSVPITCAAASGDHQDDGKHQDGPTGRPNSKPDDGRAPGATYIVTVPLPRQHEGHWQRAEPEEVRVSAVEVAPDSVTRAASGACKRARHGGGDSATPSEAGGDRGEVPLAVQPEPLPVTGPARGGPLNLTLKLTDSDSAGVPTRLGPSGDATAMIKVMTVTVPSLAQSRSPQAQSAKASPGQRTGSGWQGTLVRCQYCPYTSCHTTKVRD